MNVTFARSGVTARWDPSYASLLELAEAQGLTPDQSCRLGICSACIATLTEGEVEYSDQTVVRPAEGAVLICCSRPRTDVVIEI